MSRLTIEQVELSSAVFFLNHHPSETLSQFEFESNRLIKAFDELRRELRSMNYVVEVAALEFGTHDGFSPERAKLHIDILYRCLGKFHSPT